MKKKGFTLVELLAVIAILAILVIVAMPNVLGMFNQSKANTFVTEVQEYMNVATTSFMQNALSTQGKTSLLTSAVVTARNNRVVPINNIQTFKYISSVSTLTENTNSTTEVTPEEESVGFSMQLMPNILENGKLM